MSFMKKVSGGGFVEPPGVVAYFPFNGNANDESGNGYDLTVSGASLTTGRKGDANGAYELNGTSDFINSTVLVTPLETATGSWSIWVKPNGAPAGTTRIIGFYDKSVANLITLQTVNSKLGAANFEGGFRWSVTTDDNIFVDATWVHLGLVHTGSDTLLYVDGVFVDQTFSDETNKEEWIDTLGGVDTARIGSRKWNGAGEDNFFKGDVDDVRYYDRALTAGEMATLASE